jgi:hypothetical protein
MIEIKRKCHSFRIFKFEIRISLEFGACSLEFIPLGSMVPVKKRVPLALAEMVAKEN